jgi:hypothetical protein
VRGSSYAELGTITAKAILMEVYNQRYSDIDNMSIVDVMFFLRLHEANIQYQEQEIKKEKNKGMRRSR